MKHIRYIHLFDRFGPKEGGLCIAYGPVETTKDGKKQRRFGMAVCSVGDSYCKETAREIATDRYLNDPRYIMVRGSKYDSFVHALEKATKQTFAYLCWAQQYKDVFHHFYPIRYCASKVKSVEERYKEMLKEAVPNNEESVDYRRSFELTGQAMVMIQAITEACFADKYPVDYDKYRSIVQAKLQPLIEQAFKEGV